MIGGIMLQTTWATIGDECVGCGQCIDECQLEAIQWNDDGDRVVVLRVICDTEFCQQNCKDVCPVQCIYFTNKKGDTVNKVIDYSHLKITS